MTLNRRAFLATATAASAALAAPMVRAQGRPRVVVIGGGSGGGTAARYIAKDSAGAIDVVLIEPTRRYYTCYFSNLYLGGFWEFDALGHGYGKIASDHGVNVVHDWAVGVDRDAKTVALAGGGSVPYDRLGYHIAAEDAACLQGRQPDPASEGASREHARGWGLRHGCAPQPLSLPARPL
jgi:sulfide dehydrogenase [flavocytochrome c] flavoprotein subunit